MENSTAVEMFISSRYREPGMSKVISVKATPAVAPGENFLSDIWRLRVTILLENNEVRERNFIFKQKPIETEKQNIATQLQAFSKEIMMYELVFKKMNELMADAGDRGERPWCEFVSHFNYESLLLEDLKPLGYCPANKLEGLNLDEAKLVFRSLGRFHAASSVVAKSGVIQQSFFEPRKSTFCPKIIEIYFVRVIRFATKAIEESWGPQWKDVAVKLNQPTEVLVNKIIEYGRVDESKFNVILHGDLWTNNMLFKKDQTGEPKAVKFVDLQLSFYNTVSWDLTYLAYTSLNRSLRKQHLNYLLKIYSESLQENLSKYGYSMENIPTYEYVLEEMKRLRFWAFVTLVFYYAIILTGVIGKKEDALTIMNPAIVPTETPEVYKSQVFKDAVGKDFIDLINDGVMD